MEMSHDWKPVALKEVASSNSPPFPDSGTVWHLGLDAVEPHTGRILEEIEEEVAGLGPSKVSFDERNVLYSKLRPYLNKVVVPERAGVGTSELIALAPNPEKLDRHFLAYYLRSTDFVGFAVGTMKGATLPRTSMRDFWKHEIPLPALSEQQRIVRRIENCLERIEEARYLRSDALRDAEALEAAVFADFLEDREDHLDVVPLGDVIEASKYGTSKKANTNGRGYPCLRMGNIQDGQLDVADLKHVELSDKEASKVILREGDLIINRTNSLEQVGKSAVFTGLDGDWVYASYLVRLRPNPERVLPAFLNAVINSRIGRSYVYKTARRAIGMVNVNATEIKALPVPVPSLEEQAETVKQMNQARRAASDLLENMATDELDALTGAVLRKAFAGEL